MKKASTTLLITLISCLLCACDDPSNFISDYPFSSIDTSSDPIEYSKGSSTSVEESSISDTSSTSSNFLTSYPEGSAFRLSPSYCGSIVYTFNEETYSFADSGYEITITDDCLDINSVCLYWMAYRKLPPNYFMNSSNRADKNAALAYGINGRCASKYYVGEYQGSNSYTGKFGEFFDKTASSYYWELDIDYDGSYNDGSKITRGSARVVIVERGLVEYEGDGPVCFYTYDHYDSFKEFYNYLVGLALNILL